jgi:hypothetical protein
MKREHTMLIIWLDAEFDKSVGYPRQKESAASMLLFCIVVYKRCGIFDGLLP